jgi:hypothetical protein
MERNQIQGFRVNIQANSNPFPDDFWMPSGNYIVSFVPFQTSRFVSFESIPKNTLGFFCPSDRSGCHTLRTPLLRINTKMLMKILDHPKCKAFINHAGFNGVIESISAAVPMILVPLFGDQNHNAAVLKRNHLGIFVGLANLTEHGLTTALQELLQDNPRLIKSYSISYICGQGMGSAIKNANWVYYPFLRTGSIKNRIFASLVYKNANFLTIFMI